MREIGLRKVSKKVWCKTITNILQLDMRVLAHGFTVIDSEHFMGAIHCSYN